MAYQSIFNSNGVISLPNIQAQFVPGQYAKVNAAIAARQPVNPQTLTSTPALTTALKAGQINQNQFANRYNSIFNKPVAAPYSTKNTVSALGGALNKVVVQPVTSAITDTGQKVKELGSQLTEAPALTQQRQAIITNQSKATTNPEYQKAVVGMNMAHNSASGVIQAQRMAAQGAKASQIKSFLQTDAQKLNTRTQQGINALGVIASTDVGEGSLVGKVLNAKQTFIDGPKALLEKSTAQRLAAIGEKANTPTKINVEDREGAPATVPVKTPIRPGIRQESTTSQINVRTPNQMTDEQFTKEFNALSKSYDKDTKQLGIANQTAAPADVKAASNKIEAAYQGKLNDLLDRYHTPDLTAPKAPKTVASSVSKAEKTTGGLQQSPLAQAVTRARSQAITRPSALDNVELPEDTATVPKTAETGATKPTEATTAPTTTKPTEPVSKPAPLTTPGEKVSGSSIRTQAKAVEAGMKSDEDITGATYKTVSHKAEAQKAVQLLQDDPEKAKDIAMGRAEGDNASHEAAVYHAVANDALTKAKETGDFSTVRELANAPRHTAVSEAAQKLGAEGYNVNPHDPVSIMGDIAKSREKALSKSGSNTVDKELAKVTSDVKANTPRVTRQSWSDFVDGLKC